MDMAYGRAWASGGPRERTISWNKFNRRTRERKRPKGEGQWELIVSGFDCTPVLGAASLRLLGIPLF
jgi:hypothetical protein